MSLINEERERPVDQPRPTDDPVLKMLGVGRQLWEQEPGDRFIDRLRSEDVPAAPPHATPDPSMKALAETIWLRIQQHQGESFHTSRGLPFIFDVEGNGIWFFRDRKRINRKLTRAQTEVAISRCPLKTTTEINDLMDYPYLFAMLMDPRIRGQFW